MLIIHLLTRAQLLWRERKVAFTLSSIELIIDTNSQIHTNTEEFKMNNLSTFNSKIQLANLLREFCFSGCERLTQIRVSPNHMHLKPTKKQHTFQYIYISIAITPIIPSAHSLIVLPEPNTTIFNYEHLDLQKTTHLWVLKGGIP